MSFQKKTVRDIDLKDKRVIVRVDYNVPMEDGKISSDFRIEQSLPTLRYLLGQNCSIILISHLGRPEGHPDPKYSLKPAAECLSKLLNHKVQLAAACIGPEVEAVVKTLKPKEILMLENVRFHAEEEKNDDAFAKQLASYGEIFVQDCFGVAHRAHASIVGIPKHLPSVAGLLLEKEVDTLTSAMEDPQRPLMAIIGGAKISDKIKMLKRFIKLADFVAIGGAMANTFLLAEGVETGKSLTEADDVPLAKEIMEQARQEAKRRPFIFYLPQDGVVATDMEDPSDTRIVEWDAHTIADIESYPRQPSRVSGIVKANEAILDIGPISGAFIAGGTQLVKTVIWNGTLGVTETDSRQPDPIGPFSHGTEVVVEALVGHFGHRPYTIVGGGDTVTYVEERGLTKAFNHVSTGGGASLEVIEGKTLPGVECLPDKNFKEA